MRNCRVLRYAHAGAVLLSVLTEPTWFKGSLADMLEARTAVEAAYSDGDGAQGGRPLILRKDFIVDEYQLVEAVAHGADTVLLIVAILPEPQLTSLLAASRALGMEPLVEVANEGEMRVALRVGAKVVGVNNRNLHVCAPPLPPPPPLRAPLRPVSVTVGEVRGSAAADIRHAVARRPRR